MDKQKWDALLTLIGLYILAATIMGFPTMFLWNILMTDIFELPRISLYQAIGLNFLSSIFFKTNININKL